MNISCNDHNFTKFFTSLSTFAIIVILEVKAVHSGYYISVVKLTC